MMNYVIIFFFYFETFVSLYSKVLVTKEKIVYFFIYKHKIIIYVGKLCTLNLSSFPNQQ